MSTFGRFFVWFGPLSPVICQPIHVFSASCGFEKYQKMFSQNIYPRERCNSDKWFVVLWICLYEKQIIFHWITTLFPNWNLWYLQKKKLKRKYGHRETVGSLSKVQKKMDTFFLKELKEILKPLNKSENISSNLKVILSPEPFAFKGFPANTMT